MIATQPSWPKSNNGGEKNCRNSSSIFGHNAKKHAALFFRFSHISRVYLPSQLLLLAVFVVFPVCHFVWGFLLFPSFLSRLFLTVFFFETFLIFFHRNSGSLLYSLQAATSTLIEPAPSFILFPALLCCP